MNLDRYTFEVSADHFEYEFISQGPKGPIKKMVRFNELRTKVAGQRIFNLALGDWNADIQDIDDEIVSNNGDTEKVLATVALIAVDFTNQFPDVSIIAAGSTPARTRKYQMGINKQYGDISNIFDVFGVIKGYEIQEFRKNVNYDGFLIRRKVY